MDRLGRSLADLMGTLTELEAGHVDLFLHQQAIDTTTPAGRMFFHVTGAFAEFERGMIRERVNAGLARAKAETPDQRRAKGKKAIGRPKVPMAKVEAVRARLAGGMGMLKVARELNLGTGTVQRIRREMTPPA